ncbi:tumor necrosis factor receptor superfamily member 5 [Symphorus nematophorus]
MNCPSEDKYTSKDKRCCNRCPAGKHVTADCDGTKETECTECGRGFYTATKNHLNKCQPCRNCSSNNNQKKVKDCTPQEDTVCECVTGFFCSNAVCDHCQRVTQCPEGKGVKVQATRTNDTICAPCEDGTFSNVTDFTSACQRHTRCDDLGRLLKTAGTGTTDAICGDIKPNCHWILPASLWSGLVLTALVLFGLVCWREKRKSYRTACSTVPVRLIEMAPAPPHIPLDLPLPSTKLNGYCQESCAVNGCNLPLFNPDDNVISSCTEDSMDSCSPITPLKVSVSFAESNHGNGSAGYGHSNFLRTHSEPQEDEWCGT